MFASALKAMRGLPFVFALAVMSAAMGVAISVTAPAAATVADPVLEVTLDPAQPAQHFSRSQLLSNPALRTIDVADDAAYHRAARYRALPLAAIIPDAAQFGSLQFTASDGFVANIPGTTLAGPGQAWLAIEPIGKHWPPLKAGSVSAGPFYLVWTNAEQAGISPEQWPYQIVNIAAALPLEQRYPQIVPHGQAPDSVSATQRGLRVYIANCAACHQINGGGDAAIGPDLNLPSNPTEYFQPPSLRKLIRNPASVRNWGQRLMPAFPIDKLTDASLDDLLAYLQQMASQRP
jgi:mono/diheme cytochrome c family protein